MNTSIDAVSCKKMFAYYWGEGQIQLTLPHNGDGSDLQVEVVKLNYFL